MRREIVLCLDRARRVARPPRRRDRVRGLDGRVDPRLLRGADPVDRPRLRVLRRLGPDPVVERPRARGRVGGRAGRVRALRHHRRLRPRRGPLRLRVDRRLLDLRLRGRLRLQHRPPAEAPLRRAPQRLGRRRTTQATPATTTTFRSARSRTRRTRPVSARPAPASRSASGRARSARPSSGRAPTVSTRSPPSTTSTASSSRSTIRRSSTSSRCCARTAPVERARAAERLAEHRGGQDILLLDPNCNYDTIGAAADKPNPFRAGDVNPVTGTAGALALPFRPATDARLRLRRVAPRGRARRVLPEPAPPAAARRRRPHALPDEVPALRARLEPRRRAAGAEGAEGALRRRRDVRQPALAPQRLPVDRLGQDRALPQPGPVQPAGRRARLAHQPRGVAHLALGAARRLVVLRRRPVQRRAPRAGDELRPVRADRPRQAAASPTRCSRPARLSLGQSRHGYFGRRPRRPAAAARPVERRRRPRVRRAPRVPLGPLQLRDHRLLRLPGLPVRRWRLRLQPQRRPAHRPSAAQRVDRQRARPARSRRASARTTRSARTR